MSHSAWLGIGAVVGALLGMLAVLDRLRRRVPLHPELSRKLAHVGLGLVSLSFPWLFEEPWPVLLLNGLAVATLLALRIVPGLREGPGTVVNGIARASAGDLYFPIATTVLFLVADGETILYVVPVLTLALADAVAAAIGVFYGRHAVSGAGGKTVEGSLAFLVVAFLTTHVPLLLFTDVGRLESLLIGAMFGMLVMLLEVVAWRGLDNVFIPIGGFLLLRESLSLGVGGLSARLLAVGSLMLLVLVLRRSRTLSDCGALAAVLVGYVAWSVGGWRWVIPPLVLFLVYSVLWPRRRQVRDRPHDSVAVLSVASCGLVWLFLSGGPADRIAYFAYTVAFAAHLCFIGVTWYRDYGRRVGSFGAVLVSATVSWSMLLVPYLAVVGLDFRSAVAAGSGILAILATGAVFALVNGKARHEAVFPPLRWVVQALLGFAASVAALPLVTALGAAR